MTTNKSLLDGWTPLHLAVGVVAGASGISYTKFLIASVIFEVIEHSMESPHGSRLLGTKRPESPQNVAGDLLAGSAGYLLVKGFLK